MFFAHVSYFKLLNDKIKGCKSIWFERQIKHTLRIIKEIFSKLQIITLMKMKFLHSFVRMFFN